MENWGLITYRESALLFDPKFSSIGNKERIVTVIAHEVAHQVFSRSYPPNIEGMQGNLWAIHSG